MNNNVHSFDFQTEPDNRKYREAAFIEKHEKFICSVVWNYASIGGNIEANQPLIEDMIQEAKLAVITKLRNDGNNYNAPILGFGSVIKNACLGVIVKSKTIRVPEYWFRKDGRDKADYTEYECANINDFTIPVESFENAVIRSMLVQKLMDNMPEKARQIYILVGDGHSPYYIEKKFGIHRYTVSYWLKKGGDFLRKEMGQDGDTKELVA